MKLNKMELLPFQADVEIGQIIEVPISQKGEQERPTGLGTEDQLQFSDIFKLQREAPFYLKDWQKKIF